MKALTLLSKGIIVAALALTLTLSGCSFTTSDFNQILNEVGPAVVTVLQIVALVEGSPANGSIGPKISSDVAAIEQLHSDFSNAATANKASIVAELNAAFTTLQLDLTTIFKLAAVKDTATQIKITALLQLITSAVQIAENAVPNLNVTPAIKITYASKVQFTPAEFVDSYNKLLIAKTGIARVDAYTPTRKLHLHSKLARTISLGHLN